MDAYQFANIGYVIADVDSSVLDILRQKANSLKQNFTSGVDYNKNLAGKIADEFKVTSILSENNKSLFTICFQQYLQTIKKSFWNVSLENAWINDMKSN